MRWRDVKKGKIDLKEEAKKPSFQSTSILYRIKAFLTDSFMITMPIVYLVFYVIMGSREEFRAHMLLGWVYILIPHFIVITGFLYFKSQTPGYKAYNLKLVTFKMQKPTFFQIAVRYFVFTLTLIVFPLLFIAFFTKNRYGLQDIVSRTMTIYSK